jgi:hypothetical protein
MPSFFRVGYRRYPKMVTMVDGYLPSMLTIPAGTHPPGDHCKVPTMATVTIRV